MQLIIATIMPDTSGPQVGNLIEALFVLLKGGVFKSADPRNHVSAEDLQKLATQLEDERAKQFFDPAATQLVQHFQTQQSLGDKPEGDVDDDTAARMNDVLRAGLEDRRFRVEVSSFDHDHLGRLVTKGEVRSFERDLRGQRLSDFT